MLGSQDYGRRQSLKASAIHDANLRLVVLVFLGLVLMILVVFLLVSTLMNIRRGDLTIDVEIRKRTLRSISRPKEQQRRERYFWVPYSQVEEVASRRNTPRHGVVVHISSWDNPYDQGTCSANFAVLLRNQEQGWPLNIEFHRGLIRQAKLQIQQQDHMESQATEIDSQSMDAFQQGSSKR